MKKIILVTGGQRSGKSTFAEQLALTLADRPIYMATSRVWDDEYHERIKRHQLSRGSQWTTIEENKHLSQYDLVDKVVLIDCLTLWATNFFFDLDNDIEKALTELKQEFERLIAQQAQFILVTNEIGLGGTSENNLQRKFIDLLGWLNQYVAAKADEVYFVVSGIAMKIKSTI